MTHSMTGWIRTTLNHLQIALLKPKLMKTINFLVFRCFYVFLPHALTNLYGTHFHLVPTARLQLSQKLHFQILFLKDPGLFLSFGSPPVPTSFAPPLQANESCPWPFPAIFLRDGSNRSSKNVITINIYIYIHLHTKRNALHGHFLPQGLILEHPI